MFSTLFLFIYNYLMQPKIEIKALQKSYTDRKKRSVVVLYHLDLSVRPGEFLVILGESGCGKSSLLKVIAGIEEYDFGDIYFDGVDALKIDQKDKNMSLVSQNYVLFPNKTVYENIDVPLANLRWSKKARVERILELSKLLGLDLILSRRPKELSGGQAQRVAIARSIAKNPDICLFDEPLSALDPVCHGEIIDLLQSLHKKTFATYLYSTHNQKEAFALGDRIAIMHNMKIEQIGTKEEILNHPISPYICSFLKDVFVASTKGYVEEDGRFYSLDGDFSLDVSSFRKCFRGKEGKEITLFVRKDAISIDMGNGVSYPIKKRNAQNVEIEMAGQSIEIDVDEDFDGEAIKLAIDPDRCAFFEGEGNLRP